MGAVTAPPSPPSRISDAEFQSIRRLVYDNFGINLTEQKRSLVVGRLQKVLRDRGFAEFKSYLEWLTSDQSGVGLEELANRISTNHTFFWRENSHFEFFRDTILAEAAARHRKDGGNVRFWCAGCSSGEEPYTLVMLMLEVYGREYDTLKPLLLATDISATALSSAMRGVYGADRVERMPANLRSKYFERGPEAGTYRVVERVRSQVVFRRHNLMNPTFPFKKPFDSVFCRNVMIYFDKQTRDGLVSRFHRHTATDGYLLIGHSETLGQDNASYAYVMPACYRRR
ncbi:MAG: protein-glutamate O-methyltransferase CheR [Candidatus Krumholzibacteriia bacterium]